MRIYKYTAPLQFGTHEIVVPRYCTILKDWIIQGGNLCAYGYVNPDQTETATLQVGIAPTGSDLHGDLFQPAHHVATLSSGGLVYHIFARGIS